MQQQERQATTRTEKIIKHADDDHFVVNMYALHNATRLWNALPSSLKDPRPLYTDRRAHHDALAVELHMTQTEKRAQAQASRKATNDAKKAKKRKRTTKAEAEDDMDDNDTFSVHGSEEENDDEDTTQMNILGSNGGSIRQRQKRRRVEI